MFTLADVKGLLKHSEDDQILSLYLHVDNALPENQASNPAWRIWFKKHLRAIDEGIEAVWRENWEQTRQRAETFFEGYIPGSKSLVAFFGPDWEQTHALPVPVEPYADYGKPVVGPLLYALDEYEPYLVVRLDLEEARFYESFLGQAEFRDSLEIELEAYDFAERTGMPASARVGGYGGVQVHHGDKFDDMIEAQRMRFYREVAERARQLAEQEHIERLILGGNEQSAHTLKKLLPEKLRDQVVDIVSIPGHYSAHEIFQHIQPLALDFERTQEEALVDAIVNAARAGGRAILGPQAVDTALENQQVAALVLAWPPEDAEQANGRAYRALALNSDIEMVHGPAAQRLQDEAGGVAARLYYTL